MNTAFRESLEQRDRSVVPERDNVQKIFAINWLYIRN